MKVLMLGDSPLGKTGFGRVNSHALTAFLRKDWTVASVTGLQSKMVETPLPLTQFNPPETDPLGLLTTAQLFEDEAFDPDIIYMTCDPGSVAALSQVIPARVPVLAYVPIEGEPLLNKGWRSVLSAINFFTCSKYGVEIVKRDMGVDIDYVYHGVDTNVFYPMTDSERAAYRTRLGWDGKFVVTVVAQNVRRKQLTRLIEAIAIIKHQYGVKDVVLYLHTVPFQGYWLEGHNLPEVAAGFHLTDEVVFNPLMSGFGKAIPENGDLDVPGLRELVGSADLFVLPSQVEGFGLPLVEAMAVGTPVATTKYAAGWEVARLGGGTGIEPHDWEIHKSGTRYANLDPQNIAKTILALKRDPRKLARMRGEGLEAVKHFKWSAFEELVIAKAKEVRSRHEAGTEPKDESNLGGQEAGS